MMQKTEPKRKRSRAQALPEYALILVFMALALVAALTLLGGEIDSFFTAFSATFKAAAGG